MEKDEPKVYENEIFKVYEVGGKRWASFLEKFRHTTPTQIELITQEIVFPGENKVCFLLRNVLTHAECQFLIKESEELGYDTLKEYRQDYRDNSRAIVHQKALAEEIFTRVKRFLPPAQPGMNENHQWVLNELNDRWRFCRYDPGQHFSPHYDGRYVKNSNELSKFTFMAYLNGSFEGGATNFLNDRKEAQKTGIRLRRSIQPEEGMFIVFEHEMFHEGEVLKTNRKYIMRSDIMYKREYLSEPSDKEKKARAALAEAESLEEAGDLTKAGEKYALAFKLLPELRYEH
jgi:hypothetical protein